MSDRKIEHKFKAVAERCHPGAPLFCFVPKSVIAAFGERETFVVEARLNDKISLGRRTVKPWGDGRWFTELSKEHCRKAQVGEGDQVRLALYAARKTHPALLAALKKADLMYRWRRLSRARQRAFSEHVFAARKETTRRARIERAVECLGKRTDR